MDQGLYNLAETLRGLCNWACGGIGEFDCYMVAWPSREGMPTEIGSFINISDQMMVSVAFNTGFVCIRRCERGWVYRAPDMLEQVWRDRNARDFD